VTLLPVNEEASHLRSLVEGLRVRASSGMSARSTAGVGVDPYSQIRDVTRALVGGELLDLAGQSLASDVDASDSIARGLETAAGAAVDPAALATLAANRAGLRRVVFLDLLAASPLVVEIAGEQAGDGLGNRLGIDPADPLGRGIVSGGPTSCPAAPRPVWPAPATPSMPPGSVTRRSYPTRCARSRMKPGGY
jgi:hypothetical protein